jgi:hypothetical protein
MEHVQRRSVELPQGFQLPFGAKVALFLAAIALLTYASAAFAPAPDELVALSAAYAAAE